MFRHPLMADETEVGAAPAALRESDNRDECANNSEPNDQPHVRFLSSIWNGHLNGLREQRAIIVRLGGNTHCFRRRRVLTRDCQRDSASPLAALEKPGVGNEHDRCGVAHAEPPISTDHDDP